MEKNKNIEKREELIIPKKLFNALFSKIKVIQYHVNVENFAVRFWGDGLEELTGYKEEMFTSKIIDWSKLIHPEDLDFVKIERDKILTEKDYIADSEYRIIHINGEIKWVRDVATLNAEEPNKGILIQGVIFDITKRKLTDKIIQNRETHYRQTVENSPNPIFCIDLDGMITSWNNAAQKVLYFEDSEIIGKHYSILLWNKNDIITIEDRLELLNKGEISKNIDLVYRSKNHEKCFCITRIYPIKDPDGRMIGTVFANTDVTERKEIQHALQISESKFSKIFQASPDSIYISRIYDGIIIDINKGFTLLTGYTADEIIPSQVKDAFLWMDIEDKAKFVKRLLINGEVNNIESYIKHKSGIIKACLISARIIDINEEKCALIILRDITERKIVTELLKESEETFRRLFEESADSILLMDNDKFLDCNKATIDMLGYENKTNIVGKNPWHISPEYQPDGISSTVKAKEILALAAKIGYHKFEWEYLKNDKSRVFVEVMLTRIHLRGRELFYVTMRDITERKRTEQELIRAKDKAEVSEKLKSAFLAQMSHEIRSPLYRILGYITLIKDFVSASGLCNNESEEYFYRIDLSGKRLIRTIDSILNMSELQTNSYSPVFARHDLYLLLQDIYKEYQMEAGLKELKFILNKTTENTYLLCDEYSVCQIFVNLIDNAIKYTKEGCVTISIGRNGANNLFVEINDTGIGMSDNFKEKLFQPFSQEETGYTRKFEGNGLGLALVKNYCQINNATIEVKSEKWKGTSFKIVFS